MPAKYCPLCGWKIELSGVVPTPEHPLDGSEGYCIWCKQTFYTEGEVIESQQAVKPSPEGMKPWRGYAVVKTQEGSTVRRRLPRRTLQRLIDNKLPVLNVRRYLHPGDRFMYIEFDYF